MNARRAVQGWVAGPFLGRSKLTRTCLYGFEEGGPEPRSYAEGPKRM
jgi:hypothetical protein